MTILDAVHDPLLFRPLFKNLDTWQAWFVVLRSVFGLPMTAEDLLLFRELTGRDASARGIRPPFDPSAVVKEFCALLKAYRVQSVRATARLVSGCVNSLASTASTTSTASEANRNRT